MNNYDISMMSRDQLEGLLRGNLNPVEINRVIAGYEISDSAFTGMKMSDESPYFFHLTRVARIIISELGIFDPDLIIASLLHDYTKVENVISRDILEFNFGPYLVYLVDMLSMTVEDTSYIPNEFRLSDSESLKMPIDDYLIIKLAEQVDYFRALKFDLTFSPVAHLCDLNKTIIPIASNSSHEGVKYLINEFKMLKNKIIG